MNLSGFKLGRKDRHDVLVLLDAAHSNKKDTFYTDFVMIVGAS